MAPFLTATVIAARQPARERSLDIARVKDHLLRLFTDLVRRYGVPFGKADIQFILAGYSWRSKDFRIWTIGYLPEKKELYEREATVFCPRLQKIALIGDWAKRVRRAVAKEFIRDPFAAASPRDSRWLTDVPGLVFSLSESSLAVPARESAAASKTCETPSQQPLHAIPAGSLMFQDGGF